MGWCPFQIERKGQRAAFPGKMVGGRYLFRSAGARSGGETGKRWARTVANHRDREPDRPGAIDLPPRSCVARRKRAAERNPEPETTGGAWKDLLRDWDL